MDLCTEKPECVWDRRQCINHGLAIWKSLFSTVDYQVLNILPVKSTQIEYHITYRCGFPQDCKLKSINWTILSAESEQSCGNDWEFERLTNNWSQLVHKRLKLYKRKRGVADRNLWSGEAHQVEWENLSFRWPCGETGLAYSRAL